MSVILISWYFQSVPEFSNMGCFQAETDTGAADPAKPGRRGDQQPGQQGDALRALHSPLCLSAIASHLFAQAYNSAFCLNLIFVSF
jgi:hypothetical protein